jgi:hypothetical protein
MLTLLAKGLNSCKFKINNIRAWALNKTKKKLVIDKFETLFEGQLFCGRCDHIMRLQFDIALVYNLLFTLRSSVAEYKNEIHDLQLLNFMLYVNM